MKNNRVRQGRLTLVSLHKQDVEGGGTMVSFYQIGANTKKMCAKKTLNKKISIKFLKKLKPRTSKLSKKFLFSNGMLLF